MHGVTKTAFWHIPGHKNSILTGTGSQNRAFGCAGSQKRCSALHGHTKMAFWLVGSEPLSSKTQSSEERFENLAGKSVQERFKTRIKSTAADAGKLDATKLIQPSLCLACTVSTVAKVRATMLVRLWPCMDIHGFTLVYIYIYIYIYIFAPAITSRRDGSIRAIRSTWKATCS